MKVQIFLGKNIISPFLERESRERLERGKGLERENQGAFALRLGISTIPPVDATT